MWGRKKGVATPPSGAPAPPWAKKNQWEARMRTNRMNSLIFGGQDNSSETYRAEHVRKPMPLRCGAFRLSCSVDAPPCGLFTSLLMVLVHSWCITTDSVCEGSTLHESVKCCCTISLPVPEDGEHKVPLTCARVEPGGKGHSGARYDGIPGKNVATVVETRSTRAVGYTSEQNRRKKVGLKRQKEPCPRRRPSHPPLPQPGPLLSFLLALSLPSILPPALAIRRPLQLTPAQPLAFPAPPLVRRHCLRSRLLPHLGPQTLLLHQPLLKPSLAHPQPVHPRLVPMLGSLALARQALSLVRVLRPVRCQSGAASCPPTSPAPAAHRALPGRGSSTCHSRYTRGAQ